MNETFEVPKLGVIHNGKYYVELVITCENYDFRCKSRKITICDFEGIDNYIESLECAVEIYSCLKKNAYIINKFNCEFKDSIDISLGVRRGVTPYFLDRDIQTYPKFWGNTIKNKEDIELIKEEWRKIKLKLLELKDSPK